MRLTWPRYGGLLRYVDKTGVPAPAFSFISNARCQRCSGAHFESTLVRATSVASVISQWAFRHMLPPQTPLWRSCVISCHTPCSRSRSSAPIRAHIWRRTPCTACLQNTPCRRLPPPASATCHAGRTHHDHRRQKRRRQVGGVRSGCWRFASCESRCAVGRKFPTAVSFASAFREVCRRHRRPRLQAAHHAYGRRGDPRSHRGWHPASAPAHIKDQITTSVYKGALGIGDDLPSARTANDSCWSSVSSVLLVPLRDETSALLGVADGVSVGARVVATNGSSTCTRRTGGTASQARRLASARSSSQQMVQIARSPFL